MFQPRALLMLTVACALPILAVAATAHLGKGRATSSLDLPAPPAAEGLQPLHQRQVLHPAMLQDSYLCRVPLANGSDHPIAITGATTSCGCAALRFEPEVIPAGDWGEAIVLIGGRGRYGFVDSRIEAATDDGRDPTIFEVRLVMPPLPTIPHTVHIPADSDEFRQPITGGDNRFPLRCMEQPTSSNEAIAVSVETEGDGLVLVCHLTGARPAASRVTLQVGYGPQHRVDLKLRVIAR